ncbi:family 16 glycoside hydrolase [Xylariales sp. AK1849]|nr:family 16 glycoside hydrolase [Xylariales sp. AK1849]
MLLSRRIATAVAVAAALLSGRVAAQTYTSCNPLQQTCSADTALGMTIDVDFTQGEINSFSSSGGTPTYGSDGVSFTVAKSGDAPQLNSLFYIMFGRVEFELKAAPGAGIVSSFVMQSDDLDEIDLEWLGADSTEVATNYFGKGETTTYNRGEWNPAAGNQDGFIKYIVDWTSDRIVWTAGGTVIRTLTSDEAEEGQYPQTPMQIKFGAWSGGDSSNSAGTISWARGPTDYSQGPFTMTMKNMIITDYSTGSSYSYGDTSGLSSSIKSNGGTINGNLNGAGSLTVTATAAAGTATATIPAGGIGSSTNTVSASLPSGWVMTSSGKVVPSSSAAVAPPNTLILAGPIVFAILASLWGTRR